MDPITIDFATMNGLLTTLGVAPVIVIGAVIWGASKLYKRFRG